MLARGHALHLLRRGAILRPFAGQRMQHFEHRDLALDPVLDLGRDPARIVEAADRDGDAIAIDVSKGQRRAAIPAETALHGLRTLEDARLPRRPDQILSRHARQWREVIAESLLAHPAMADAG